MGEHDAIVRDAIVCDAIVIGAGIAGLMAALHLAERGWRPLVLEADPQRPGGRLKGGPPVEFEQGGQLWRFPGEHGVHGVWSPYRNFQATLSRHRIRPVLVPAREEAWIHGAGGYVRCAAIGNAIRQSWVPAPFHYLGMFARLRFLNMLDARDFISLPRMLGGLLAALSIDPLVEDQARPNFTMADYCQQWSPKLIDLFAGLTRNAIPAPLERIPAVSFIAFLRFYTVRRRDDWAFSYLPDDGHTAVVAPLAATLAARGGTLRLGAKVSRLEQVPAGWQVSWSEAGLQRSAQAPYVILATDAPAAEALLRASPGTAAQAGGLRLPAGMPTAIFRVWFNRAPSPSHACQAAEAGILTGDFVLDNFFWLHRIYNTYIEWGRATGGSAIESHVYGPPELLARPDDELLARAVADVERAWPELKGHRLRAVISRNEPTHTLLDIGRPEEHLAVRTPWPGLFCCGDWVRDPNPALFLERACVTGIQAANAALAGRGLPPWLLLDYFEPEPLVAVLEAGLRGLRRAYRRFSHRAG